MMKKSKIKDACKGWSIHELKRVLSLVVVVNTSVDILRSSCLDICALPLSHIILPNRSDFICSGTWNMTLLFSFCRGILDFSFQLITLLRDFRLILKPFPITPVLDPIWLFSGGDNRLFIKRVVCNRFWVS